MPKMINARSICVVLLAVAFVAVVPLAAQDAEKKPSHIFDFGGFDDAPATQPTVRERSRPPAPPVPARTPVPGVVTPSTPKPPTPAPPTPKPPVSDPPPTVPPSPGPSIPVAPPVAPDTTQALLPVPVPTEASRGILAVNKLYANELTAAQDRMSRRNMALKIDAASSGADLSATERYAAAMVALQVAVLSGDAPLAVRMADRVANRFAVDELSLRSTMVLDMAAKAITPHDGHALATAAIPVIEAATREDDFDLAEKLTLAAEQCAVRAVARDSVLAGRVRTIAGDMRATKAQHALAKPALDAIAAGTATPAQRTMAGKYVCFSKGYWSRGLPILTDCDDPKLKAVALADLAMPLAANDRMTLADRWWTIASAEAPGSRAHVMDRAAYWYRELLPQIADQDRNTPQVRITQAVAAMRKLEPGLIAEIFHDPGLRLRQRVRIDPVIVGDFSSKLPDPNVDPDIFGVRWTGMIKAPRTGTYTFNVKVKESIRIWIDGMMVLRSDNPTNKATVDVLMVEGLHDIRIHYNSRWDKSMVRITWTSAGQFTDQEIGGQYLFHDARAGGEYLAAGSLMSDPLDRTARVGGLGGGFYDGVAPDAMGTLAGFRITTGSFYSHPIIKSIVPVFQDSIGQQTDGQMYGSPGGSPQSVVARPGYAVASVTAKGGQRLDGFKVTFARVNPNGSLKLADTYESEWVGGNTGGKETLLGGDGRTVVGICGRGAADIDSMGLILRGKPVAGNAMSIVSARWGGPGNKWADVTVRVRVMVRDNKPMNATHTDLMSDPTPGKRKKLEIIYNDQGIKKSITFDENEVIAIPGVISR
ncbi:PA14 domain-containing protein [Humisphaera borealis]|uniref:PA14 domain-containing protein n=1 Tax=Humisphaera borealis TaxID=2807512 RepID=A0A7M2X317_9BACT|nr:PA14 domain-containing protein [Humisphaera borealis]QOV91421.1 hypothetical protein IPV69_08725 [Humisphaera borealis]